MTSLAVWASVDPHGVSSVYIVTDSRISWNVKGIKQSVWDFATKVFYCRNSSDVFGYSGSSLAIVKALSQVTSIADTQGLFSKESTAAERHIIFSNLIKASLKTFPIEQIGDHKSTIVHCSQTIHNKPKPAEYEINSMTFSANDIVNDRWNDERYEIPNESSLVLVCGSGATNIKTANLKWKASEIGRTSRAVFSSIVEAIEKTTDPNTGGAPQLVGLYRHHLPKLFGLVYKNKLFVNGLEVSEQEYLKNIEWRNELFEICDWRTKKRDPSAQPQPKPRSLI